MTPIRPSITNRQLTMPSLRNMQNEDKEFKDQLKILYHKQKLYDQKKEQVRKHVSPKRDDILCQRKVMKIAMENQLNKKIEDLELAKKDEQTKAHYEEYCNKYCGPHNLDATTTQIKDKRNYLKNIMEENKQSECKRKEQNLKRKELEIEADHICAITPCCWNRRHYL